MHWPFSQTLSSPAVPGSEQENSICLDRWVRNKAAHFRYQIPLNISLAFAPPMQVSAAYASTCIPSTPLTKYHCSLPRGLQMFPSQLCSPTHHTSQLVGSWMNIHFCLPQFSAFCISFWHLRERWDSLSLPLRTVWSGHILHLYPIHFPVSKCTRCCSGSFAQSVCLCLKWSFSSEVSW